MQWVLVIMLFGANGSAINADLWFAEEQACRSAAAVLIKEATQANYRRVTVPVCIQVRR